jgi:CxxC motif-containing protein (DUF1111 family)
MTETKLLVAVVMALLITAAGAAAQLGAKDPGLRGSTVGGADPKPLPGLTASQLALFNIGLADFRETETVGDGLGPRFNLDNCARCPNQPATGGSSSGTNPQVSMANRYNVIPSFITADGPVREVRYKRNPDGTPDGGVHALFVISGRPDTDDRCTISQPNFDRQYANGNVSFRIPTPVFGAGLIEQIPDSAILGNRAANAAAKAALGIAGRPNRFRLSGEANSNPNDGTVARFGWKAQNKSLLLFSGEAYNVEMGITNELFPTERDETAGCQYAPTPNDTTNTDAASASELISAVEKFAAFMRFLAPPQPSPDTVSITRGRQIFAGVGCAYCHTPTLYTGYSSVAALNNQPANLYSDLMVHNMGPGLADDISQGAAGGDEFRTAPLWGLGQRIFLLHDGRTTDLIAAIRAHKSAGNVQYRGSEANLVIDRFNALPEAAKQDLLNFLRSL